LRRAWALSAPFTRSEFSASHEAALRSRTESRSMSTTAALRVLDGRADPRAAAVEIVVPVYNEDGDLEASIRRLHAYLTDRFPLTWLVTIADNASTDRTWAIASWLARTLRGVRAVHLDEKGRGRALRAVWSASASPVVAY